MIPMTNWLSGTKLEARLSLLRSAADKPVCRVLQLDGFTGISRHDDVMHPDADGDAIMFGMVDELRRSGPELPVRVHVHADADAADVLRVFDKLRDSIESALEFRDAQNAADWMSEKATRRARQTVPPDWDRDGIPF